MEPSKKSVVPKRVLRFVGVIFVAFFLGTMLVIFITLCIPIYVLRGFVSLLKPLGPGLGNMISPLSSLVAIDDIYTNPKFTVLLCSHFKDDVPEIVSVLRHRVFAFINTRLENGNLQYPELQQFPYEWLGFLFWRWDKEFLISNHIDYYNPNESKEKIITKEELSKIQQSLVLKEYSKNRSPWEILIVRNVESENGEPHCVLLIRFHHSIGDGFAIMRLRNSLIDSEEPQFKSAPPKCAIKNFPIKLFYFFKNFILAPYQYTSYFLESFDKNELIDSNKFTKRNASNISTAISEKISLAALKKIAVTNNVSLTTVIFAGLTGAIRKMMIRKNIQVPQYINIACPVPMPWRPRQKLTNHASMVFVKLPVGECSPFERLKRIEATLQIFRNPFYATFTYCVMVLVGNMFPWMIKIFQKNCGIITAAGSTFPGPKQNMFIHNHEIVDTYFIPGPFRANFPIIYCTLTYCDSIKLVITTNCAAIENEEVKEILSDIQHEFHIFIDDNCV